MPYELVFQKRYDYSSLSTAVSIETILKYGGKERHLLAKIDTGAECCLFTRGVGNDLGLDIERGFLQNFSTLAGQLKAYGHTVTVETLGYEFESMVFFSAETELTRNLLGRRGWLDQFRLALIEYDRHIFLSPYNE